MPSLDLYCERESDIFETPSSLVRSEYFRGAGNVMRRGHEKA